MSVLLAHSQAKLEDQLIADGLLTEGDLERLKKEAIDKGRPLFEYIIENTAISDEHLTKAIAEVANVPYVNLSNVKIEQKILNLLPLEIAERYMAVPLGESQNRLLVAMLDAGNVQAVDFLSNKLGRPVKVFLASETGIRGVLSQYEIRIDSANMASSLAGDSNESETVIANPESAKVKTIVQDSPISKALSAILEYAAKNRASDIHIESLENELRIRARIDGVLREVMKLPKSTEAPLVSRIKILSNLKIDEHRIPQDGQFTINVAESNIDLRIAISPVVYGEQVIIRLLDKSGTSLRLSDMGYTGRSLRTIKDAIQSPNGMILTSGPTGSGKSTSLYALIQEIKSDEINIVTLEDPVEYKMDGINQIQVNTEVGLTFAAGLRSILRQDPDVVMVGEIRDNITAQLAVQASLTGHLVFSTLHTNSASGILPRLLDMEIEPFLIASTVRTVIGQRLVRRIHVEGREAYTSSITETEAIKSVLGKILPKTKEDVAAKAKDLGYQSLPLANQKAYTLYKGTETPKTPGGYKGRLGLYEAFDVTEEIQKLIIDRSTSAEIQQMAIKQGMISMRQDGYLKALAGLTTLNEVNRVTGDDSA